MMASDAPESKTLAAPRSRSFWRVGAAVFALVVILAVGWGARSWSAHWRNFEVDPTPLPRPDVNAPFITTPYAVVDKMVEMAQVSKDDVVYDLGCGDGRIVIQAAKQFGCRGVGFDIDPQRITEALALAEKEGVSDLVTFEQQDVFTVDLRPASVVMIYLLPRMNLKLVPQLQQLNPGSRIVCHDFGIEGYEADETVVVKVENESDHYVHRWVAPIQKRSRDGAGSPQ